MTEPATSTAATSTPAEVADLRFRAAASNLIDTVLDNLATIKPVRVGQELQRAATAALRALVDFDAKRR